MFNDLLKSGLSLDRLHSLLIVCEAGTIAKAAALVVGDSASDDTLRSRQALISRQLRELEAITHKELTVRHGKNVVITKAGQRLAALARHSFLDLDSFRLSDTGESRTFVFGAGASLLEWLVCPQMPEIMKSFPGVTIRVESRRTGDLIEQVRDGRIDFAIVRANAVPDGHPCEPLGKAKYLLAVPEPLAKKMKLVDRPSAAQMAALPLALQASGGDFHRSVLEAFAGEGVNLRAAVEAQSFTQVRGVVESGCCAGILPENLAARLNSSLYRFLPLPLLAEYVRPLALHWSNRQMERRDVAAATIKAVAQGLRTRIKESPLHAKG